MFKNRIDAGEQLAKKFEGYRGKSGVVVLGIPRGGVVVASVVAKALHLPLDVVVIKKVGLPGSDEFAIGATGPETFHVDQEKVEGFGVGKDVLDAKVRAKQKEAKERRDFLSDGRAAESLKGKKVILVDDGIATGETMALAVDVVRKQGPKKVIVGVPVASEQSLDKVEADEIVCVLKEKALGAIGEFYEEFSTVGDSEVKELLASKGDKND
jgi:predicted phosphoribosyltransferase